MTSWFPYLGLGSPQFLHYQSLPSILTGVLGLATGGDAAFRLTLHLLLALFPLPVYWSARLFDLGRGASLLSAAAAPLLMSAIGVGYEAKAYVWIGYGVWAQLWASWALPLAWGFTWRAMSSRRAVLPAVIFVALTVALHFETGYLALIALAIFPFLAPTTLRTRLPVRAAVVGLGALLVSAWVTVPVVVQGRWAATNEVLAHTPLVNGYGAKQVMSWLLGGQLLDAHRFPVVTVLGAVGLVTCIARWRTKPSGRAVVALLVMSLLLSFGRTTFGALTVLLPGSTDIFMRRFMMGAQLAALLSRRDRRPRRWCDTSVNLVRRRWPGVARWAAAPISSGGAHRRHAPHWVWRCSPRRGHRSTPSRPTTPRRSGSSSRPIVPRAADVDRLIGYVTAHGGGRVYAGMPSNWGSSFTVGAVPVFKYLESRDVDEVGYTLRTASLMTDPEYFFDETDPGDYQLFAVRYLILPVGHPPPVPARLVMASGVYRLWVVPQAGYIRVVDTVGVLSADRTNVGVMSVPYLRSDLPASGRYLTVAYGGAPAAPLTTPALLGVTGAAGTVRAEHDDLVDGSVTATVVAHRTAAVVLSSSFDPGWSVRVDGRPAAVEMLAPALPAVRVGPGVHSITFSYIGFGFYPELFAVGVVTLVVLIVLGPLSALGPVRSASAPRLASRLTAPPLLDAVHGVIGLGQQVRRDHVGVTGHGETDAHAHTELDAVDGHGCVERRGHSRHDGGGGVLVDALAQHDELVPTEMGSGVGGPDDGFDAPGRLHQDLVPDRVAEPVVDAFEPVDVAEQHGQCPGLTAVPRQGLPQAVVEQVPVGEPRDGIVRGPVCHL